MLSALRFSWVIKSSLKFEFACVVLHWSFLYVLYHILFCASHFNIRGTSKLFWCQCIRIKYAKNGRGKPYLKKKQGGGKSKSYCLPSINYKMAWFCTVPDIVTRCLRHSRGILPLISPVQVLIVQFFSFISLCRV